MQETWVQSLLGRSPEVEMTTHSSILAWIIPWTKEPGRLQSMGSRRIRHNWACIHAHRQFKYTGAVLLRKMKETTFTQSGIYILYTLFFFSFNLNRWEHKDFTLHAVTQHLGLAFWSRESTESSCWSPIWFQIWLKSKFLNLKFNIMKIRHCLLLERRAPTEISNLPKLSTWKETESRSYIRMLLFGRNKYNTVMQLSFN